MPLPTRFYGTAGPLVIVLHGGPGAAGHVAPLARGLAERFQVVEPFQREDGPEPLTVARHVADLHAVVESLGRGTRPALVGSSWGAMLALAYAARHPGAAGPVVLVGCGTFDREARAEFERRVAARTDDALRERLAALEREETDPGRRLRLQGDLLFPVYSHDPLPGPSEMTRVSARAHHETWEDMVRLQDEGVYPAAFAAIRSPVLMLHGTEDPHPGRRIRDGLFRFVPRMEYREWENCGHYPWAERQVREEFFAVLTAWLERHAVRPPAALSRPRGA